MDFGVEQKKTLISVLGDVVRSSLGAAAASPATPEKRRRSARQGCTPCQAKAMMRKAREAARRGAL